MEKFDIVVIGGGAGGLVVASGVAQLGARVALIEKEKDLGGDCLHYGCVPSKTLIGSARLLSLMRRARDFGIDPPSVSFEFANIMQHMRNVIAEVGRHDDPERFRNMGCTVLFGQPRFLSPHELQIGNEVIRSKRFVIATGSHAALPPIDGLKEAGPLTNVDVFRLTTLPRSLVVLGGGPIGVEMAQVFARFGSRVTVLEMADHILPREDEEVTMALQEYLRQDGVTIHTGAMVSRVSHEGSQRVVAAQKNGEEITVMADEILVAAGRAANVEGLNLAAAGVEHTSAGILVNDRLQTTAKNIYAVGDVNGKFLFTHMAEYEVGVVIANALFHIPKKVDDRVVPWTTFTDPELARVGITEAEARGKGLPFKVYTHSFRDVDRAVADAEAKGLVKLVCTPRGKILGVSILGPHAGDILHEFVLAMTAGLSLRAISSTIHVYPTLGQIARKTANAYYAEKLFSNRVRRLVRFLGRVLG